MMEGGSMIVDKVDFNTAITGIRRALKSKCPTLSVTRGRGRKESNECKGNAVPDSGAVLR
jgi:hypothetical protein